LIPDEECRPEYFEQEWTPADMRAAYESAKRADAWARSVAGTPYGGTEPVRSTERSGGAPEPLDRRVMAKLLEKGSGR
jgi:hypothetical protein